MRAYYIRISSYGGSTPHIIDEEVMYQAERRMNSLNPDDFMYLCDAENMADAKETYWEETSKLRAEREMERFHP